MKKYRKKPVVIEACQFNGKNIGDIFSWMKTRRSMNGNTLVIHTLEGDMYVSPGDWIICGVHGEFYPCKPDIFNETYERENS